MVLAEEVQDGNVLNLSDNVLGVIQSKMLGEVEDDNFNDPDYNLEEDDDDYHDFVTQRLGMKAKGRPKKGTSNRSNVVGPPTNGILIPQVNENAESDYYDSDELLEWGTDSEDEVEYTEHNAENDNPILEVGMISFLLSLQIIIGLQKLEFHKISVVLLFLLQVILNWKFTTTY
ncbi:hypothetical protein FXO38_29723 [Capsicum annuum]|nr:hypothetical protein FXO38_29723 [Capsicum annuum]